MLGGRALVILPFIFLYFTFLRDVFHRQRVFRGTQTRNGAVNPVSAQSEGSNPNPVQTLMRGGQEPQQLPRIIPKHTQHVAVAL